MKGSKKIGDFLSYFVDSIMFVLLKISNDFFSYFFPIWGKNDFWSSDMFSRT